MSDVILVRGPNPGPQRIELKNFSMALLPAQKKFSLADVKHINWSKNDILHVKTASIKLFDMDTRPGRSIHLYMGLFQNSVVGSTPNSC